MDISYAVLCFDKKMKEVLLSAIQNADDKIHQGLKELEISLLKAIVESDQNENVDEAQANATQNNNGQFCNNYEYFTHEYALNNNALYNKNNEFLRLEKFGEKDGSFKDDLFSNKIKDNPTLDTTSHDDGKGKKLTKSNQISSDSKK